MGISWYVYLRQACLCLFQIWFFLDCIALWKHFNTNEDSMLLLVHQAAEVPDLIIPIEAQGWVLTKIMAALSLTPHHSLSSFTTGCNGGHILHPGRNTCGCSSSDGSIDFAKATLLYARASKEGDSQSGALRRFTHTFQFHLAQTFRFLEAESFLVFRQLFGNDLYSERYWRALDRHPEKVGDPPLRCGVYYVVLMYAENCTCCA